MNLRNEKIWIAGHEGMVGSALMRKLRKHNLLISNRSKLNLTNNYDLDKWFNKNKPSVIINAAAKVGGILANKEQPVDFLLDNLKIQNNIFEMANKYNASKLIFLGSACSYPRNVDQPILENEFFRGEPEQTNIWYATAKIAGIKLGQAFRRQYGNNFICAMPTNSYGPGDNFNDNKNHVIPALLKRFHLAKKNKLDFVEIWGSGKPLREFLFVDDLADAIIFLLEKYNDEEIINVGSGQELSILELAKKIAECVGYNGQIKLDLSKPDGAPRKLLSNKRLTSLGWRAKTDILDGLESTYKWAVDNKKII